MNPLFLPTRKSSTLNNLAPRWLAVSAAITALIFVGALTDARAEESTTNTNEFLVDPYFGSYGFGGLLSNGNTSGSFGTLSLGGGGGGLPLDGGGTFSSQATTTLVMQDSSFPTQFNSGGDFFNNGETELGMWANSGAKQTVGWANLGTSGLTGTARNLQIGDVFTITVAATRAFGQIGFSLNAGGTQGGSYANNLSGSRMYISTDSFAAWSVKGLSDGATASLSYVPIESVYKDYRFTIRITSQTTADVFLTVDGTDYRAYNLTLAGSAGANISALSIFGSDMWDGNSNDNAYWKQTSTIQDTGRVELGYFLGSTSTFTPGLITDGLTATSTSTSVANAVFVGGSAGSQVNVNQNNTYTGATTVNNNASLEAQHQNALGSTAAGTTVSDGGVLKLFNATGISFAAEELTLNGVGLSGANGALRSVGGNNTWNGNITLNANSRINADTSGAAGSLTIAGNITGGSRVLFLGANGAAITLSGALSGDGASQSGTTTSLYKDGASLLTLSGNNTYTGDTRIVAGSVTVASGGTLGNGNSDVFISSGATLNVNTSTTVDSVQQTGNGNAGVIAIGTGATLTVDGANKGTLFQNSISGDGGLTMAGSGDTILALFGTQSYAGATTVSGGTISSAVALSSGSYSISGGTFRTTADGVIGNSATFGMSGGTLSIGGNEIFASAGLNLSSGTSTISVDADKALTTLGALTGSGNLTKSGAGALLLDVAHSSYNGTTTLGAGTLRLGADTAIGTGGLTIDGGTLASEDGTARSIANNVTMGGNVSLGDATGTGAFTISGTVDLGGTARTFTVANTSTLGGAVSNGGLTKAGSGTLVVSSASSSYSGATTVNAGRLEFNGVNTSTAATINNGASMNGTGSIGAVTVNTGGRIGAGISGGGVGNLSMSSLTIGTGSGYNWEISNVSGTAGTNWDLLTIGSGSGTVTVSSTSASPFTIHLLGNPTGWNPAANGSWVIMNAGSMSGFSADKFAVNYSSFGGATPTGTFSFSDSGGDLLMSYSAPVSNFTVTVNSGSANQGAATGGAEQFSGVGATLTKLGVGTLVMTNSANDYTGSTTIAEGAISITVAAPSGSAGALGSANSAVNIGTSTNAVAASFDFGAAVQNSRDLTVVAGNGAGGTRAITTSIGSGTATQSGNISFGTNAAITVASGSTLAISGELSGSGGININGSGTTVISGNNATYAGGVTNANGSTLRVGHNSALGTGGLNLAGTLASDGATARTLGNSITMGGNATLGDGTGTGDLTLNGTVALNGATRTFSVANNTTLGGAIGGSAGNGLTKSGSGTLTLSGANTFSGTATVSDGRMNLSGGSAIADGTAVSVSSGATLGINTLEEIGSLTGAGNVSLGALLIAGGDNSSTSYSGVMSGSSGFVKKGSGVMTLSTGYTYSGETYIVGGTLLYNAAPGTGGTGIINIGEAGAGGLASIFAVGGSGLSIGNNILVRAGDADTATIDAQNTTGTTTLNGSLTLAKNADIRAASGGGMLVNGNITGNFTLGKRGTGTVTLAGTTAGGTKFDLWEGELQIGSADNLGNSTTAINNKIYFDGGTLGGTGTFTIGSNNGMFVGSSGAGFRVASGNTLTVAGAIDNGATNVITKTGAGTLTLTSTSNSGNNRFDLLAGELQVSAIGNLGDKTGDFLGNKLFFNGGALGVTGNITLDGENGITFGGNGTIRVATGNTLTLQGYINDGSSTGLTLSKTGAGTLFFDKVGVNDFSGTTLVINEGVVSTWNPDLLPSGVHLGSATAATSGTYRFAKTDGGVTANNNFTVNSGGGGIQVTADTLTIGGTLSGSGDFSKTGAGTLTLTGNNGYNGALTVSAGTLQLNRTGGAALASVGSIGVSSGAKLLISQSGQASDSAVVTLSGGTIQRASGVSEVFGDLNVTQASFLDFSGGTGGAITFSGLDYTPSALLSLQLVNFTQGNTLVFQNSTDMSGLINTAFTFSGTGGFGSTSFSGSTFTITAIPEPSTYLAAAGLLAMFLWPVRRRLIKDAKSILGLRPNGRDRIESYRSV